MENNLVLTQEDLAATAGTPRAYNDFNKQFFVDASGSTRQMCADSSGKPAINVFGQEIIIGNEIIPDLSDDNTTSWSSEAYPRKFLSGQLTDPACIFSNSETKNRFNNAEVIVFATDGEISQCDVENFQKIANLQNRAFLAICIFVCKRNVNISAAAPFLSCPDVLCIHHNINNGECKIIRSTGQFLQYYPEEGATFDATALLNGSFILTSVPANYITLAGDGGSSMIHQDYMKILESQPYKLDQLSISQLESLVRMAKTQGGASMEKLRKIVETSLTLQQQEVANISPAYEEEMQYHALLQEMQTLMRTPGQVEKAKTLREPLRLAQIAFMNASRENQKMSRTSGLRKILAFIHDMSSANAYNKDVFFASSNRAKSAKKMSSNISIRDVDFTKGPLAPCLVCFEDKGGPQVIWLNVKDIDGEHVTKYTTCNMVIDRPFMYHDKLQGKIFVNNPVCGNCIHEYLKTCNGKTLFGEPFTGFVPAYLGGNNKNYYFQVLAEQLFGNRQMNHSLKLFISLVDSIDNEWFANHQEVSRGIRQYIQCSSDFTNTGKKMSLPDSINSIILLEDEFLSQPSTAAWRICKWANEIPSNRVQILVMAKKRYLFGILQTWRESRIVIHNKANNALYNLLFTLDTTPQTVVNNNLWDLVSSSEIKASDLSLRLLTWDHPDMVAYINEYHLHGLDSFLGAARDTFIIPSEIADFIYKLTKNDEQLKAQSLFRKLDGQVRMSPEEIMQDICNQ
jgi:hypothetical protein